MKERVWYCFRVVDDDNHRRLIGWMWALVVGGWTIAGNLNFRPVWITLNWRRTRRLRRRAKVAA